MTDIGLYLQQKSANKAEIARRTGIHKTRVTEICNKSSARPTYKEVYLIALAVGDKPDEVFMSLNVNTRLLTEEEQQAAKRKNLENHKK